jgi:alkylation response protein AidB-like acyl-CoA dehydrogenase
MPARSAMMEASRMRLALTPEQEMLRDSVRGFLTAKVGTGLVRRLMETDAGFDEALWAEMAQQGWQAMAIPEEHGGAGFTMFELGVLMEEMGRALTPAPFLSSVVLGANAFLLAGSEEQRAEHLPAIAAGEERVALAVQEPAARWSAAEVTMTARGHGTGVVLDGEKSYVLDGHTAHTLLVAARNAEGGVDLFVVPADAAGVSAMRLETLDMTRKQAAVTFDGVQVAATARLGEPGAGGRALGPLLDLAVTALAFEQVGGAERCMEMSVGYAKDRIQFGRPIGSFQAVKHMCADMLVEVEAARSAAYYAGWAAATGDADFEVAAPLAKARCSTAYLSVAAETIQVHGGIGFTWEHDAHLYFKRAKTDELLFGDPATWRAALGDRIGL